MKCLKRLTFNKILTPSSGTHVNTDTTHTWIIQNPSGRLLFSKVTFSLPLSTQIRLLYTANSSTRRSLLIQHLILKSFFKGAGSAKSNIGICFQSNSTGLKGNHSTANWEINARDTNSQHYYPVKYYLENFSWNHLNSSSFLFENILETKLCSPFQNQNKCY